MTLVSREHENDKQRQKDKLTFEKKWKSEKIEFLLYCIYFLNSYIASNEKPFVRKGKKKVLHRHKNQLKMTEQLFTVKRNTLNFYLFFLEFGIILLHLQLKNLEKKSGLLLS
ncbi:hypothetical protein RFI_29370 [Reticulomyxa filosa]|uniref:Uncharacterized protein n=1 Tax=Reticulomyxa filosa TaxID=46433 RepID=X6M2B6_RETFI|nr:hypothetical protein RFI_29370 [Reticulomyxa filosa]|eukprot:ETO08019.1 hypothetical protein RFI_29370 [Reticulomyxa filosa]